MNTSYITDYYNSYNEDERTKSRHGSVEFTTNMKYIRAYVPQGGKILDVGAGTGVYSMALAMDGYDVHAVELVEHNIEVFRENLKACGAEIPVEQGNALDLSRFADESFDAVLLFGPLYHLYTKEDKLTVLREAKRIVKPGGRIFAAYCMNTHLAGKSLSDVTYGEMIHFQNILNSFYDTQEELEAAAELLTEDTDPELAVTILKEKLQDMAEDPKMNQALVWYYLAQFADSPEESRDCLLRCLEEEPMHFTAMTDLGTRLRRSGDLEGAQGYYEKVLHYEKKEPLACRGMAILKLLEGDKEEALTWARTAYENGPDALYVRDTYLVTLWENGMTEEAGRIREEMDEAGTPVEEDTEALLRGEITLREYYMEEDAL